MRKYRKPLLSTTIMTTPFEVDENEADVEVEYTYTPGDPGVYTGPLENSYPASGPEVEVEDVMYVVERRGHQWVRTGEARSFDALPEGVQEAWRELIDVGEGEAHAEAAATARACRRCRGRDCSECPL